MSVNLNKKGLIDAVVEKMNSEKEDKQKDVTLKEVKRTVDALTDVITEALAADGKVDIAGFGKFEVKHRAEREGINPATKEKITIAASKAPSFKAAKGFKDAVK
ncbi:MAG: HU family DNA-binding protein [Erysipelotrichaceae bacterium]